MTTYSEILQGIIRHRLDPFNPHADLAIELERKMNEVEWALQAMAERLAESENAGQ